MKKRLILILLSVTIGSNLSYGQETDTSRTYRKIGVKANYFGEFVLHPGFTVGIDYSLHQKKWFNLHWDSEMGMYFHKWNNNSFFTQTSIGTRFISSFGAFTDLNVGMGYMLSSPNGDVYTVNSNNELSSKGRSFTSHLKPTFSILFGWDGTRKKNIPLLIHTGIEAYWQSHFNQSMLPHAAYRLGVVYKLKSK